MTPNDEFMTTGQVARLLHVQARSVRNWIMAGRLTAVTLPSGQHLIPVSEVERILAPRRISSPPPA